MGLLLHPADLLLRHELADRGDPKHPRPVRGADVDTGHQQPDRDRRRRALRGDAPGQGAVDHHGRRGAAARDRHHARRGGADRRADPVAARGRVPVASHAPVPARRSDRDGPDGRLDVGLRGLPVGRLPRRPDRGERGLGRTERLFRVLHRVAAVPAAVRDHRHLGDHGAAASNERARECAPVLAGQGRLLDRRPAGLGARRAGVDLPLRARRAARGVPDRLVPQHRPLPRQVHRRGLRPVLPRPGALHADPAAAAGLLLVPGQPHRRLRRPAHHGGQHRGRPHRAVHCCPARTWWPGWRSPTGSPT